MTFLSEELALDTESRRLPGSADYHWLSVALVGKGGALLHTPVKPMGLALEDIERFPNLPFPPEVLYQAPPPSAVRNMVKELVRGCTLLLWYLDSETRHFPFLQERDVHGRRIFQVQDVMRRAAPYVKEWNSFFADYENPSLQLAAAHFDLEFQAPGWHDARADAQMILSLIHI